MSKVWFITGSSKGFGREFVLAALERGDKVAATARNTDSLSGLVEKYGDAILPIRLDVTDRDQVFAAVKTAHEAFGRLDVVINNAGYGLFGAVEEISEQQLRDQFEVNLFGVFHVTQAVLPILREQQSGHIIQISSIGGLVAFPNLGGYHASKWALEGLSDSLAQEVAGFGIKVTLVEPGGFDTDWSSASAVAADAQPQYAPLHEGMAAQRANTVQPKPVGFGAAILTVVDAETAPRRVFFGEMATQAVPYLVNERLAALAEWAPVALLAEGK
ncbi:SDR family NAD(P)-dependent oxidoreductase [Cryobacterium cryoconiti]|uniref:SDR family NAD(P)-dependent oxidoreductase n=1 Tax=Cryobacterium cryoconiti TaxID=1259239 RepID=A0A4Y8K0Z3_9MICO|nr:SDR family NAD(P)-dependent oxidoreductase [Cryobacterium cryoconiti]TFD33775.1 SDR family NAD(P)-dependent oxidoreductase [Cryobacterium cryoconiti]